jgi:hypothetical protein
MLKVLGEPNQGKSTDAAHLKEDDVHLKEDNPGCSHTNNENVDAGLDQLSKDGEDKVDKVEEPAEKMVADVDGKITADISVDQVVEDKNPTKRKVIKKVMKVVRKKTTAGASANKSSHEGKNVVEATASETAEVPSQQKSGDAGKEQEVAGTNQQPEAKKTRKKKIIRRIVKRKVSASGSELAAPAAPAEIGKKEAQVQPEKNVKECSADGRNSKTKLEDFSKAPAEDISNEKKEEKTQEKEHTLSEHQSSNEDTVWQKEIVEQKDTKKDVKNVKKEQTKDDKEKRNRNLKIDSKQKTLNDTKEKKRSDEPPKYPGFILQAKRNKESKVCLYAVISFVSYKSPLFLITQISYEFHFTAPFDILFIGWSPRLYCQGYRGIGF